MKFDRNTVIGFLVLAALFIGYFWVTNKQQSEYRKQQAVQKAYDDSVAAVTRARQDTLAKKADTTNADSVQRLANAGRFPQAASGTEQLLTLENDLMTVTFSSKGGMVKQVELKNYNRADSSRVKLASTEFDKLGYLVNTGRDKTAFTGDLFFTTIDTATAADGSRTVTFTLPSADSSSSGYITHRYTVRPGEYMVDYRIDLGGADQLLTQGNLNLTWQYAALQQEPDIDYEKQNTQVGYVMDGDFDYHTIGRRSKKEFDDPVSWVGVRQRFFFSSIVSGNSFNSGKIEWTIPSDSTGAVVRSTASMKLVLPVASRATADLQLYYGPSDYQVLKAYNLRFEKLVNLGQGMYAFVRPINRYIIMPIFDFFRGFSPNLGIAIALLTIFIRLLTSPLIYKSYLSGARMKALRPEIAKLKEKYGEDRQAMSMEQMKMFREAGVNPLGGCIPALLQIPIFFALFSFFNAEPSLRAAPFLWANDLSAFDDPIKFGFHIPLLGSHLSLFNITAVVTSFLISWYSMSMTPDQSNPVMKYLPYIFPIFLLFFFNRLPSALTWYYTVSNTITLILQVIIQRYIIDHEKILAKIEENRKKPKTKSKWQERLEQMQEQQKKMKQVQQPKGRR